MKRGLVMKRRAFTSVELLVAIVILYLFAVTVVKGGLTY